MTCAYVETDNKVVLTTLFEKRVFYHLLHCAYCTYYIHIYIFICKCYMYSFAIIHFHKIGTRPFNPFLIAYGEISTKSVHIPFHKFSFEMLIIQIKLHGMVSLCEIGVHHLHMLWQREVFPFFRRRDMCFCVSLFLCIKQ